MSAIPGGEKETHIWLSEAGTAHVDPKHELRLSAKYAYLAGPPVKGAAAVEETKTSAGMSETQQLLAQADARTQEQLQGGLGRGAQRSSQTRAHAKSPIRPLPEQKRKRLLASSPRADDFKPASSAEEPARDAPRHRAEAPSQALGSVGTIDHELSMASQYLKCLCKHLDRLPGRHRRSAALQCIEHLQSYLK